jgi:mRNA interferase MazF
LSDADNFNKQVGQSVLAMITSAVNSNWPLGVDITNLDLAELPSASVVRMKLFTLDDRLVIRKAGALSDDDQQRVTNALKQLLNLHAKR